MHARQLLRAYLRAGYRARLFPINLDVPENEMEPEVAGARVLTNTPPPLNEPSLILYHEHLLANFPGNPRIGLPVFELEALTPEGSHGMRSMNHVLVVTHWAQ